MTNFATTEEERDFYRSNGYLLVDGVFPSEEVEECCKEYDYLFELKRNEAYNLEGSWRGDWRKDHVKGQTNPDQNMSVLAIHSLQCHSAIFTRLLFNQRLLKVISELMGSDDILLHHTKAHLKPPEVGAPFPTHQDYAYFPYKNHSMMACFIHLDDSEPDNGGLAVYPGSHKLGPLPNSSTSPGHYYVNQEQFPLGGGTPLKAKKGQVLLFSYLLVHGSYSNRSERSRRMLLFQFMSAHDEPTEAKHISPCQGLVLKGRNPKRDAEITRRHESNES